MTACDEQFLHSPGAPDTSRWPLDVPWIVAELDRRGLAVVPREPTMAMLRGAKAALYKYFADMPPADRAKYKGDIGGIRVGWRKKYLIRWQAMLAAVGNGETAGKQGNDQ